MSGVELKIKTNPKPKSRLEVEVEIPTERCQSSYDNALSRLSRAIKLPGFRKGKVPRAVLLQQIGLIRIRATALENLVEEIWREAIAQKSIEPLCEPEIKDGFESLLERFQPTEELTITFETDINPKPRLKATKGLSANAEIVKFDSSKVEDLIEDSRKQLATLVPVEDRPAQIGDIAVISFHGTFSDDGSAIEGGSAESMDIDLEKDRMIPGFIEGIIGMNINDKQSIDCEFPKDYSQESARGRKASFDITLKELKTRELPALNDSFAKQAGDKENMEDLRKDLTKRLQEDADRRTKRNRQEAILDSLINELEVELPETLIQQEVRSIIEQTASNFAQQGMDIKSTFTNDLVKSLMESSRGEAEKNLKQNLALKALSDAESIKPEDSEVEEKYQEVKKQLSQENNIDQQKLRQAVLDDLMKEQLLEWLEENNTILEKDSAKSEQINTKTNEKSKG